MTGQKKKTTMVEIHSYDKWSKITGYTKKDDF